MADATIDGLPTIGSVDRTTDKLPIWDASDSLTGEMTINSMLGFSGGNPVSTTDSQTLTNKTLTSPTINTPTLTVNDSGLTIQDNADTTKKAVFQLSGITTGNTRTLTLPDADITLVGAAATQTLTNKTLTAPTINNPTLNVDTISEFTSANGVTIDGLLIKDGLLPAGNIQPLNLVSGTGSSWAWQSWTPALTNISIGTNGTSTGKYIQIGKTVFFSWRFVFSSTGTPSTVGTAPTITLPVTASSNVILNNHLGDGTAYDTSGTQGYPVTVTANSTTVARLWCEVTSGTFNAHGNITSAQPFTWADTDTMHITGFYEAA